jgi:hypothetical protein
VVLAAVADGWGFGFFRGDVSPEKACDAKKHVKLRKIWQVALYLPRALEVQFPRGCAFSFPTRHVVESRVPTFTCFSSCKIAGADA